MLRLLGEVTVDGARPVPGRARRRLLATLALSRPAPVGVDRLVDVLWGDEPPAHPLPALQNHVSRLRASLPDGAVVVATPEGYRLDVADDLLDVARFERALARAARQPPGARLGLVEEALDLWRGTPYADLDDPDAAAGREHLARVRAALADVRAEELVATGRVHEAIAWLEGRRPAEPLRERTVELLMRAYVAAGRRDDALAVYRDLRDRSVEELGLDPSPTLRDLEVAVMTDRLPVLPVAGPLAGPLAQPVAGPVARGGPTRDVDARTGADDGVPPPAPATPRRPVVRLHGREEEAALAGRLLREHRLVTLVGPGGVGKTRLALHLLTDADLTGAATGPAGAAAEAGRVVTTVELAAVREPDDVADLVASALRSHPGAGRTGVDRVVTTLRHGSHLLLLDNCEHVAGAAAALVDSVLTGTPDVTVLATSREPLDVEGERVVPLSPLPVPVAASLFADRAAAHGLPLDRDGTTAARVRRLCEAVDGLPLAVELAAARLQVMSVEELVGHLDDLLGLLVGGRRTSAARHRSVRSLVEWSVRDLPPGLRRTFERFAVFAGPVDVATAAAVCGGSHADVAEQLAELARRSLLVQHREPGRPLRYGCLETIRAYAVDLLAARGEAGAVRDAHADLVLDALARSASLEVAAGVDELPSLAEARAAHRHLLAADDGPRALALAAGLQHPALFRMQAEVFRWITTTAHRFGDLEHPDAERVVAAAAMGAWQAGDLGRARTLTAQAEQVAARSVARDRGASAAEARADVLLFDGDLAGAADAWEVCVARTRAAGPTTRLVTRLADRAMVAGYLGRYALVEQSLAEARALLPPGPSWLTAWVDYAEGEALASDQPQRALDALARSLAVARDTGAEFTAGVAGLTWAGLQVRTGDPAAAREVLHDLLLRWRRAAAWVQQWITLRTAVELLERLGEPAAAATVLGAVEASGTVGVSGPDAERLRLVAERLSTVLPAAGQHRRAGADLDREAVVDLALAHLS